MSIDWLFTLFFGSLFFFVIRKGFGISCCGSHSRLRKADNEKDKRNSKNFVDNKILLLGELINAR